MTRPVSAEHFVRRIAELSENEIAREHGLGRSLASGGAGIAWGLMQLGMHDAAGRWMAATRFRNDHAGKSASAEYESHESGYCGQLSADLLRIRLARRAGNEAGSIAALELLLHRLEASEPDPGDLVFASPSIALALCEILRESVVPEELRTATLRQLSRIGESIVDRIRRAHESGWDGCVRYLGIAHGLAGQLYAVLVLSRTVGLDARHPAVVSGIEWLKSNAGLAGGRVCWPVVPGGRTAVGGWCQGAAGYVWLWLEAFRVFGDSSYLELACAAGLTTQSTANPRSPSLCCGLAGQAQALMAIHASTGDDTWRQRAHELADVAIRTFEQDSPQRFGLLTGAWGIAVTCSGLLAGRRITMPLVSAN